MKKLGTEIETRPVSMRMRVDVIEMLDDLLMDIPYTNTRATFVTKLIHDAWLIKEQNAKKGVYKPLTPMDKVRNKKEKKLAEQSQEIEERIEICGDLDGEYDIEKKTCVFYNYDRVGASIIRSRQEVAVKKLSKGMVDRAFGPEGKEKTLADWEVAKEKGLAEDFKPKV